MSANIEASLQLEIAQMQAALAKARGEITRLKEHAKKEGPGLGQSLFKGLVAFGGAGVLAGVGNAALGTVVKMDRMSRAMTSMEGSANAAQARLAELRETSKMPGLGFEQAVRGDVRLRAASISAETSKQALIEFGNALALAGGTASDLDGVILALGQIASNGKVSAEEINQIAERVPQVRAVMKDMFGTADTEVLQKMDMDAQQFIKRLIEGFGRLPRATAGLDEQLEDIRQSFNGMINDAAGPIVRELVPAFSELTTSIAENKEAFVALGTTAVRALQGVAETLRVLPQVGSGVGEGIGKLLGFGEASSNSTAAINRRAQDEAAAAESAAKFGPAKKFDAQGKEIPAAVPGAAPTKAAGAASPPPVLTDQKAAAKALRDEEQARAALMREQQQLGRAMLDQYLGILPPNLRLLEVQRQILSIRENIETLPMHELDKLKAQQELVRWQNEEQSVKRDLAEQARQAADAARDAAAEQARQTQAGGDFDAEMAIIDAKVRGHRDLAEQLQRQYDIEQLKRQIMQEQGVSETEALRKASARVDAEKQLAAQMDQIKNSRYDAEGRRADGRKQIKGYSAEQQGTAEEARARAEQRVTEARARVQKDYDRGFTGLGEKPSSEPGLLKDQAQQNQAQQQTNADPSTQLGQQILAIIQQMLPLMQ